MVVNPKHWGGVGRHWVGWHKGEGKVNPGHWEWEALGWGCTRMGGLWGEGRGSTFVLLGGGWSRNKPKSGAGDVSPTPFGLRLLGPVAGRKL